MALFSCIEYPSALKVTTSSKFLFVGVLLIKSSARGVFAQPGAIIVAIVLFVVIYQCVDGLMAAAGNFAQVSSSGQGQVGAIYKFFSFLIWFCLKVWCFMLVDAFDLVCDFCGFLCGAYSATASLTF
ncbi:hypothetical protein [Enterobacter sp. CC120223-11]|uniref:hypothetical protein n=1 Tax=Enterobacter sp. CC120223-11 TaxID=1378073 RepID=UPI001144D490|nr:hypothetical protein [Enterobacter sp. CC120223-11]